MEWTTCLQAPAAPGQVGLRKGIAAGILVRRGPEWEGSHTRWPVFNGTLTAFVPQAARKTAAEQEAAELPLPPARGGFSQQ